MKQRFYAWVGIIALVMANPYVAYAAYSGPTAAPTGNNTPGAVWLSPPSQQTGSTNVSGDSTLGGNVNMTTGRAINVPVNSGAGALYISNYGSSPTGFTANIVGDLTISGGLATTPGILRVPQICLNGDCKTAWPSGGGGGTINGSGTTGYIPLYANATTIGNSVLYQTGSSVGINTTSPGGTLGVNGTVSISSGINANRYSAVAIRGNRNYFTAYDILNATDAPTSDSWHRVFSMPSADVNYEANLVGTMTNNQARLFYQSKESAWVSGWKEVIMANSAGNVGIGTLAPAYKLDVNGPIAIEQKNFGGSAGLYIIGGTSASNWPNMAYGITNTNNVTAMGGNISGIITNSTAGSESMDFAFYVAQGGTLIESMRLKDSGNVGIGTGNPTQGRLVVQRPGGDTIYATTGGGAAVRGISGAGWGVYGVAQSSGDGVHGVNESSGGNGVYGEAIGASAANSNGVRGDSIAPSGSGVFGYNANTTGYGVSGYGGRYGVWGTGVYGVYGAGGPYGVYGTGGTYGVYGTASTYGVYADSSMYGVYAVGGNTAVTASGGTYGVVASGQRAVVANGTQYGVMASGGSYSFYGSGGTFYNAGAVGIGTGSPSYSLDVNGDSIQNWVRTRGATGWYNETYAGGWYMTEPSWVRTYNERSVWTGSGLLGSQGGLTIGYGGAAPPSTGAMIAGYVGIGTTSVPLPLAVAATAGSVYNQIWQQSNNWNCGYAAAAYTDGNFYLNRWCGGASASAYLTPAGAWVQYSDKDLKKDIEDLHYGIDDVMKLKPVTYVRKDDEEGKKLVGFIAQDVKAVIPELVSGKAISEGGTGLGLNYQNLTAVLTSAIQDQQKEIEELKTKNSDLEKRLEAIEAKLK